MDTRDILPVHIIPYRERRLSLDTAARGHRACNPQLPPGIEGLGTKSGKHTVEKKISVVEPRADTRACVCAFVYVRFPTDSEMEKDPHRTKEREAISQR